METEKPRTATPVELIEHEIINLKDKLISLDGLSKEILQNILGTKRVEAAKETPSVERGKADTRLGELLAKVEDNSTICDSIKVSLESIQANF